MVNFEKLAVCLELAKQSGSVSQFRKEHPAEYMYCWRSGFWDLVRALLGEVYYPPKYWEDLGHIMEAISQCDTLLELYNHYKSVYLILKANGLFKKLTACFKDQRHSDNSVSIDDIENLSKGFDIRSEFALLCGNHFCMGIRLGIIDRICQHMDGNYVSPRMSVHVLEFPDKHVYIAVSSDWQNREKELLTSNLSIVKAHILMRGHQPVIKEVSTDRDISNIRECYSSLQTYYQEQNWTVLVSRIPIGADHPFDDVIEIALSEKDYTSFRKNKPAAYFLALRQKLIEHVSRLDSAVQEQNKYSLDRILALADTCDSYREFADKYPKENQWSIDIGEIDEIKRLYRYYKPQTYYLNDILIKASQFNRFVDFRKSCPGEYAAACRNGWLEEIFKVLPKETTITNANTPIAKAPTAPIRTVKKKILTKEVVFETARACATYTEFVYDHRSEYMKACSCGWLDEIKQILPLKPKNEYTKQEVMRLATLYQTYDFFVKEQPSAYAAANKNGWLEDVKRILPPVRNSRYTRESIFALAKDCLNYTVFTKKYHAAYKAACRLGITEEIKVLFLSKDIDLESTNNKIANK